MATMKKAHQLIEGEHIVYHGVSYMIQQHYQGAVRATVRLGLISIDSAGNPQTKVPLSIKVPYSEEFAVVSQPKDVGVSESLMGLTEHLQNLLVQYRALDLNEEPSAVVHIGGLVLDHQSVKNGISDSIKATISKIAAYGKNL